MIFHKNHINDIPCQIVTHTCMRTALPFFYKQKNVTEIKNVLKKKFANLCERFVGNKLSIHFGEDKTKYILFNKEKTYQSLT